MRYLLAIFLVFFSPPAVAQERIPFCEKLSQEAFYGEWKSYRYLVPGQDGWIFRTQSDFKTAILPGERDLTRLKQLNEAFTAQGITLLVTPVPVRGMTNGTTAPAGMTDPARLRAAYRQAVDTLRGAGLHVASVHDYTGPESFYYKRDHHWTPHGAKAMAAQAAAEVKQARVDLPVKKFITETRGRIDHPGTFERMLKEACEQEITPEQVDDFTTFSPDDQANLFDDAERAKIVLLGTSNSTSDASRANYDGFLKEALSADVDNRAISGGGPDGAMLQWLASKDRVAQSVKLAIWEFPIHQDYHSKNFLRQAIPAVYGPCAAPVATGTVAADKAFIDVSSGWADKKMQGEEYYYHIVFSNAHKDDFRMVTTWADGESDYFNFKRDPFYTPDGVYFLNIEGKKPAIDGVSLQLSKPPGGTVTVNVCRIKT